MDRSNIVAFQARVTEARDILEAANQRETTRVEKAIADADEMLRQLHVRHSELLIFIEDCRREMERSINNLMMAWITREEQLTAEYKNRLAELREAPPPKLITGDPDT
jgi:cell division septum initiation protein DivIVA